MSGSEHDKPSLATILSLYTPEASAGEEFGKAHLDLLIHMAASFQFRETGIVEHLRRVAAYVEILAGGLGWPGMKVQMLKHASVLHDVGMVDVPESILKKEGALIEEEIAVLRRHAEFGRALLQGSGVPLLEMGASLAQSHHERFDGTGYPKRLKGEGIPISGRVLSVADVFDALTTNRPFKDPYPFDVAVEMIRSKSGSHFDPEVVDVLLAEAEDFEEVCTTLATSETPSRKGFHISARDRSMGDLLSIAKDAYFSCPFCKQLHPRDQASCPRTLVELEDIHKLSGTVLDEKYRLKEALGVGGMGVVYEAVHLLIGRRYAVKILKPEVARSQENITRFYNEARVYSAVGHPNLVEVTDMGWTGDRIPYFVMEMLEGIDLAAAVYWSGRFAPITAATIVIEILMTLAAVHAKGIVHRDLKPENVYLVKGGELPGLKILDFGVSYLMMQDEVRDRITQGGIIFGTPQYMSPEQAQGSKHVDQRSDLFTVGSILYEMLTGREAFAGDNALSIISAISSGHYEPPGKVVPGLPEEIQGIVEKALQVDPEARFQSAAEFLEALEAFARRDGRFKPGAILDFRWEKMGETKAPPEEAESPEDEVRTEDGLQSRRTRRWWRPRTAVK
jgi:serine/threonine protein kinase